MTLHVHQALWPQLEAEPELADVYRRIEMPTSAVLARIERTGVLIDSALLATQSHELAERMMALESEAYELAGQPFNLGSPKQIGEILFGKLGPAGGQEDRERRAVDRRGGAGEARRGLSAAGASCSSTASLSKLKGTYTDKLPLMVNPATGRVHTTYAQAVAVTGRLSSNDPNLQNIPIRTAEGRRVREAFIAPAGAPILSADYSQIELRIMAHLSADAGLLHAFGDGIDVHRATAAEVFAGGDLEAVTQRAAALRQGDQLRPDLRHERVRPGAEPGHRAQRRDRLHRALLRALSRREALHGRDPRRRRSSKGYVETLFGRRLYLPEIRKPGPRRGGRRARRRSTRRCRAPRPT